MGIVAGDSKGLDAKIVKTRQRRARGTQFTASLGSTTARRHWTVEKNRIDLHY